MGKDKKTYPQNIPDNHPLLNALRHLSHDIRLFIELSLHETTGSWEDWLTIIMKESEIKCWEMKKCTKKNCPAYLNPRGHCWLTSGTMCEGVVQGEFAIKYKSCTECEVYIESVHKDPVTEICEHLITLVYNLKATQDKLQTMATRDTLTGLYNRNYFNETIAREIERAKRRGESLSIIMIDIDRFKEFNDTYGHMHGDGILRECAEILKKAARKSDILCRYGGDEFLIITPNKDCSSNDALISRINKYVSAWNKDYASGDYELSLSIGCAVWQEGKNLLDSLHEADMMMYEDKKRKL